MVGRRLIRKKGRSVCETVSADATSIDADARVIDNIFKHGVPVDGERFLLDAGWKSPLAERDVLKTLPGDKVDWPVLEQWGV